MKTVSVQRLFEGVNELLSGNSELPSTADWASVRGHLDMALEEAWIYESLDNRFWPFLMLSEKRYFRDNWLAASSYDKTDEVFDAATQQYFQCLTDGVTGAGQSPTDSSGVERSAYWAACKAVYSGDNWVTGAVYAVGDIRFYPVDNLYYQCHTAHTASATLTPAAAGGDERWGVLTPFLRSIDLAATGQTEIGRTYSVTDLDPRVNPRWSALGWEESGDVLYVGDAVAFCWVQFRRARTRLTGSVYSSRTAYTAGDQVYFSSATTRGNFYQCVTTTTAGESPDTTAAKWAVVEIPWAFGEFAIWSALGNLKTTDEDELARRSALETAEGYLIQQANQHFPFRGRGSNVPPRVYGSPVNY